MSLFTKAGPWVAASLFAATSIFGQTTKCAPAQKSFEQGHEMMQNQMMAGYNAPARIDVRGAWDFYASGSFTYWQAIQDNMELGIVSDTTAIGGVDPSINGSLVNMGFGYKPGFKVMLGMNFDHDNWDSCLQYAWFRGANSTTTNLSTDTPARTLLASWAIDDSADSSGYFHGSEKWKLHMDLLDWEMARSYYVGTKLSFRPFFAARGAWIRQNVNVTYSNGVTNAETATVKGSSHSWAVGPRAGLYSNWMIGEGFRFYGNGAGDLLFTQYSSVRFREDTFAASGAPTDIYIVKQNNVNCVRTHLELELGLGWGSYFDNNNWHVDLSAGYGFQVFFNQNMFRHFTGDAADVSSSISPNGDLYVHGLTANLRFDF